LIASPETATSLQGWVYSKWPFCASGSGPTYRARQPEGVSQSESCVRNFLCEFHNPSWTTPNMQDTIRTVVQEQLCLHRHKPNNT
jgi:hypothetical protein